MIVLDDVLNFVIFQVNYFCSSVSYRENEISMKSTSNYGLADYDASLIELCSLCISLMYESANFTSAILFEDSYLWNAKFNHLTSKSPKSSKVIIMLFDIMVRMSCACDVSKCHVVREFVHFSSKINRDVNAESVVIFDLALLATVRDSLSNEAICVIVKVVEKLMDEMIDQGSFSGQLSERILQGAIAFFKNVRFQSNRIIRWIENMIETDNNRYTALEWFAQFAQAHLSRELVSNPRFERLVKRVLSLGNSGEQKEKLKVASILKALAPNLVPFYDSICDLYMRNTMINVDKIVRNEYHALSYCLPTHVVAKSRSFHQVVNFITELKPYTILDFIIEGKCGGLQSGCQEWRSIVKLVSASLVRNRLESSYGDAVRTFEAIAEAFNDHRDILRTRQTFRQFNLRLRLLFLLFENIQKDVRALIEYKRSICELLPNEDSELRDFYLGSQTRIYDELFRVTLIAAELAISHGYYSFAVKIRV
ncbi:hypothetical protein ACOME3_010339 [Neoechinorhynchus agilis]